MNSVARSECAHCKHQLSARICVHKQSSGTAFVFRIFSSFFMYSNAIANAIQMRRLLELNCCAASALCPLNELIYENISFRLHVWSCYGLLLSSSVRLWLLTSLPLALFISLKRFFSHFAGMTDAHIDFFFLRVWHLSRHTESPSSYPNTRMQRTTETNDCGNVSNKWRTFDCVCVRLTLTHTDSSGRPEPLPIFSFCFVSFVVRTRVACICNRLD